MKVGLLLNGFDAEHHFLKRDSDDEDFETPPPKRVKKLTQKQVTNYIDSNFNLDDTFDESAENSYSQK